MSGTAKVVGPSLSGARLDKALGDLFSLSRAHAKRAILEGAVRVNGKRVPKGGVVAEGDTISVELEKVLDPDAPPVPEDLALEVVFETSLLCVVDKPAGMPTAPLKQGERGTLANRLVARYPELVSHNGVTGHAPREPGLVHRLDTWTSGLVLVARTEPSFRELTEALRGGALEKRYLAICAAEGLAPHGTIDIPIAPHPKDKRRVYPCIHPRDVVRYAPRPSLTAFEVVDEKGPFALVEVSVKSATRHQIRAHFAATGHPLLGDTLYGGPPIPDLRRHALHASYIGYAGSSQIPAFSASSPLPKELEALIASR